MMLTVEYEPNEDARLDELDRIEFWDRVVRRAMPHLTFEEYEGMWESFQADKAENERRRLH